MTFATSREIPAKIDQVFAAFSDPKRLARWWGPVGFTNTFDVCEFKSGGKWIFTMHGPDGKNYSNENIFTEIDPPKKVIIQHVSEPKFLLTITLVPSMTGTHLTWSQVLENSEIAKRIKNIVVPANEQNLDRLTAEVTRNL